MSFGPSSKRKYDVEVHYAIFLLLREGYFFLEGEQALEEQCIVIVLIYLLLFAVIIIYNCKGKCIEELIQPEFLNFLPLE